MTNTVKESKQSGEMTTDSGKRVEAVSPAVPQPGPIEEDAPRVLSREDQQKYVGELEPGEEGFIPLDKDGNIAGPAKRTHEGMEFYAPVQAPVDDRTPILATPSGAPVTERMNPTPKPE